MTSGKIWKMRIVNFWKYIAHWMSANVQEQLNRQIYKNVEEDVSRSMCVMLMDFKTKFNSMLFRESTIDYFGKKGMSVLARYFDIP